MWDATEYHELASVARGGHSWVAVVRIVDRGMLPNASVRSKWRMVWSGRVW